MNGSGIGLAEHAFGQHERTQAALPAHLHDLGAAVPGDIIDIGNVGRKGILDLGERNRRGHVDACIARRPVEIGDGEEILGREGIARINKRAAAAGETIAPLAPALTDAVRIREGHRRGRCLAASCRPCARDLGSVWTRLWRAGGLRD